MSTHIINFPGADIHTTTITSVSNVSVGENLDVTSNLTVSGNTVVSHELSVSGNTALSSNLTVSGNTALSSDLFVTGNVGIGTTEPTESLDIVGNLNLQKVSNTASIKLNSNIVMELPKHDRPLVKYPEVAMTAATTAGYTVDASRYGASYDPFKAFNGLKGGSSGDVGWHTGTATPPGISDYTGTNNTYVGTERLSSETVLGEWITIELPNPIKLIDTHLWAQFNYAHVPKGGVFYGKRNASDTWTQLYFYTGQAIVDRYHPQVHTINETRYFKYFAYVATERYLSASGISVGEWELYGTEEGDTSVDVVHRSIPNKPGQQHLEVYWDANDSNSYSFADSSSVYDLSGNGVTGTITGTNGFDSEYNAWVFDGSGDYISGTQGLGTGQPVHSQSVWFKLNGTTGDYQYISMIGTSNANEQAGLVISSDGTTFIGSFYGGDRTITQITPGRWYHAVLVYPGGTTDKSKYYINGVELPTTGTSGTPSLTGTNVYIGANTFGTQGFNGSIANFRLFGKTLNADQVRELYEYDAPRFGHRQNLVSLHKGNLGIGLRDPEQRLVVAGSLQEFPPGAMTSEYTHFTGHGIFKAISSGGEIASTEPLDAFNKDWSSSSYWYSRDNTYGTSATNVTGGRNAYTGSNSLGGYSGEWLGLMFPCGFVCKSVEIAARNGEIISAPHDIVVLGATNPFDETEWETIGTFYGKSSNDFWVDGGVGMPFPINYDKPVYGIALVFTAGNYHYAVTVGEIQFFGVPQMNVTDGRQLNVGQVMTSSVGIGTSAPHAPLTVYNDAFGSNHSVTSGTKAYFRYDTNFTYNQSGQHSGGLSIYALKGIMSGQYVISHSGTLQASDARIKNNILDVNDSSALETFRLIQPKLYNYKDVVQRGSLPVWGFIAQEVANTLNYSTDRRTEWIPNVYELANVYADGAVLEFDTTKLEAGASKLRLYDQSNNEEDVDIAEIIDEYTVRLKTSIGNADQVFVYGQEVKDFHFLKKDAIWTTAAAALQQVDRELQAEKAKTKALESKLAGERVPLENAEGLAVDANHTPCMTANDPLFLGIVDADGRVAAKGKRAKVWVTNIGAPLSAGDIIATTSNIAGYCTKLTDLTEVHRAVGKVLVDVALPQVTDDNFVAPAVPRRRKVTETSDVTVWVREFKSTADRYATLPEDERRVRDEVYYARDDVAEVVRNEFVDKMPAYDVEAYHRTQIDTCDAEIYEALPDSEKVNYVLGEDGVYTYTHVNMITVDAWNALGDDDERESFVHGYFKNTTTELTEDEWTALDSAVQARYEKRTRPVYFRLIVARESRVGYTEEVRAETVDVLDAFGRPTYEDVEGETDPAFEFRYLTAEGEITDRHSGVHVAAMVECLLT